MIAALLLAACLASDPESLSACALTSETRLTADITCATEAECCPDGSPLLWISGRSGVTVDGQGHTLRRSAGQRACEAVKVSEGSKDITIRDLVLDEGEAAPCDVEDYWDGCADTVLVHSSPRVTLERVMVLRAAAHAVRVWGASDGFTFRDGGIYAAGMIGLYVGHAKHPPVPRAITITGSRFEDVRTNALAIMGVLDAAITDNTFRRNHWHGLWTVGGQVSGGGQAYLGYGTGIVFRGNTIADGFCGNCASGPFGGTPGYVDGLEIGEPGEALPVRESVVEQNVIQNQNGEGIVMPASTADRTMTIEANVLINTDGGIVVPGARVGWNDVRRTRDLSMWEKPAEADGWEWRGMASHWCPGPESVLQGSCALRSEAGHAQRVVGLLSPGDTVYLSAWRRSGGWQGQACIVFQNETGRELDVTCETSASWTWTFKPVSLEAVAPARTRFVAIRLGIVGTGAVDWEAVRVSW